MLGLFPLQRVQLTVSMAWTVWLKKDKPSYYVKTFSLFFSQEAEAFALYHKALDLQKHDRFEESAKAYHELLEARLLREVRHQQAGAGASGPGSDLCPPTSWLDNLEHVISPLCPLASPPIDVTWMGNMGMSLNLKLI